MMSGSDEEFIEEDDQGPSAVQKLREKLAVAVKEKQEYLDGWQRARADFANYKKEESAMRAEKHARITAELVESLLPVLDSLELAQKHGASEESEMVRRQLLSSLKRMGVERFGAAGESFDPRVHEALTQTGDGESIVSVERSGYSVGDIVVRPAQVII